MNSESHILAEQKKSSSFILTSMHVLFWIIFIGLAIKTGAMTFSFLISIFHSREGAENLYLGLNLSELLAQSKLLYIQVVTIMIVFTGIKAYIAYLVVKIFSNFNLSKPFDSKVISLITSISYVAASAGILAIIAGMYTSWLLKRGFDTPHSWGGGEILFFAGVIYIIAQVFSKGAEIQTENDLTV